MFISLGFHQDSKLRVRTLPIEICLPCSELLRKLLPIAESAYSRGRGTGQEFKDQITAASLVTGGFSPCDAYAALSSTHHRRQPLPEDQRWNVSREVICHSGFRLVL